MIATPILLDGGSALWTLLGVGGDPVAGLAVVVTFLDPLLDEVASDGIVPVFTAGEAEGVAAVAPDRLNGLGEASPYSDSAAAVCRTGAPPNPRRDIKER